VADLMSAGPNRPCPYPGELSVTELGEIKQSSEVRLPPLSYLKDWKRSRGGVNFLQTVNMSSSYQMTGDSYQSGNFRGIVPMGP